MPHLLVIGASGVLGSAASRHFLEKGFVVSAFVRDKSKAAALESAGARIRVGDLTDPGSLDGIFEGVDVVLAAAHGMLGRGKNGSKHVDDTGHRLLIEGAKRAGVKHFIYTSTPGVSADHPIDFYRTKFHIEQSLASSGMKYTVLRLPAFMEWHAYLLLGKNIVEKGKTTVLGNGEDTLNFIAVKDVVGALDAIVLNEKYYNTVVPVMGPQNFSRNEVASLFDKALGKKSKITHVPVGVLKVLAVMFKPFHEGLARIMQFSAIPGSAEPVREQQTVAQFGLKPVTMEEFIQAVVSK